MSIVITLALILAVTTLAVVLWRASAGRRDTRKIVSKRKDGLRQNDRVQSASAAPSISIDTMPASVLKPDHPGAQTAEYRTRNGLSAREQQALVETPETVLPISESVASANEESQVAVEPGSPVPEKPPGDSVTGLEDTRSTSDIQEIVMNAIEPTYSGADERSRAQEAVQRQRRESLDPEKRGGRSRETAPKSQEEQSRKISPRTPKPEIVCWKREQEWVLAVELPDDFDHASSLSVVQDDVPLVEDKAEEGSWRLAHLRGEVIVRAFDADGEILARISLGDGDYLVFKLSARDLNQGRRVKQASRGSYLVVAPAAWRRDEEQAGPAPAVPEPVCLDGHRAHFFDLSGSNASSVAFRDPLGRTIEIASGGPRFQIVGQHLPDASEYLGPLFVCTPPRMHVVGGSWANVGTIVLGEEGKGRGRWRTHFAPDLSLPEQAMPTNVMERKAGWYFVRFYDLQNDLIDSIDFRFAAGLREIKIKHGSPFPEEEGHRPATVGFEHSADWHVVKSAAADTIKIEPSSERTILRIPPAPKCDRSEWSVGPRQGPEVKVAVLVERVWWAVGNEKQIPTQWRDNCLQVPREDFTATSENAIWLRLPKCRWAERVLVGFCPEMSRGYQVRVTECTVAIPLRDFSDSQELTNRTKDQLLRVWIEVNGPVHEAAVAVIHADSPRRELEIGRIPAPRLARVLTGLCHLTSGSLRQLLKEVRQGYRRPRRSSVNRNDEFVRRGLCTIAVFLQLAGTRSLPIPKSARRWKTKAQLASQRFPETMREVWGQYTKLGGR